MWSYVYIPIYLCVCVCVCVYTVYIFRGFRTQPNALKLSPLKYISTLTRVQSAFTRNDGDIGSGKIIWYNIHILKPIYLSREHEVMRRYYIMYSRSDVIVVKLYPRNSSSTILLLYYQFTRLLLIRNIISSIKPTETRPFLSHIIGRSFIHYKIFVNI